MVIHAIFDLYSKIVTKGFSVSKIKLNCNLPVKYRI